MPCVRLHCHDGPLVRLSVHDRVIASSLIASWSIICTRNAFLPDGRVDSWNRHLIELGTHHDAQPQTGFSKCMNHHLLENV